MVSHAKRIALILIGLVSLALGAIGVFLPLLPTTPFVLVSAIAFAKSSDRLHQWLVDHDLFGPLIANWREHGAISRRTKVISVLSMIAILVISTLLAVPTHVIVIQAVVLSCSAVFILTRPLPPQRS
jgi:uncharacterized membrane protein YbaN (DUF454 family)